MAEVEIFVRRRARSVLGSMVTVLDGACSDPIWIRTTRLQIEKLKTAIEQGRIRLDG